MKTDFKTVMTNSKFSGDGASISYIKSRTAILTLGFKAAQNCEAEIKFSVFINGELAVERQVKMTNIEDFVKIPFEMSDGDIVTIEAMNRTDVTDILLTYQSIGM